MVRTAVPTAALAPSPPAASWLRRHTGIAVRGEATLAATDAGRRLAPALPRGTVPGVTCPCAADPGAVAQPATIPATAHAMIIRAGLIASASFAIKDASAT
jgi:hypothetical protein